MAIHVLYRRAGRRGVHPLRPDRAPPQLRRIPQPVNLDGLSLISFFSFLGLQSKPQKQPWRARAMTATKRKPQAARTGIPPKVQKAIDATDPKTRKLVLELIKLKESGLLNALK